ncbi:MULTISPECIES: DUF6232 family protein [unclassified Solwaraspora]|uniref:DUF6232 family protein n=1 Tax=unclassified Solwaraspora TaxID=2627926 RepID=UPI00248C3BD7|nr:MULTISPECIES: DUF6232 family protein [unclassified Solwaraspora]WBB98373.1 DUF6232 family protein [Solwaraspora sp. WMMA2059]WBC23074.1 DUF6232 family protein [Solwaraspora sp. WMMA2080]WJK34892.1 DUF6232 family protein [Solwaraspora sp. WMMA2065]
MTTYYDDKSVRITSTEIRVDQHRHPLTQVHRIWQRRGARSWSALAGRGMVGVAFLAPVATALLGLVTALTIDASPTVTIALIGGSILVGLVIIPIADLLLGLLDDSYDRGAHLLELWADVRGAPVLLVSDRDALRVGRIHRALRRAVEAALASQAPAPVRAAPARRALPRPTPGGADRRASGGGRRTAQ